MKSLRDIVTIAVILLCHSGPVWAYCRTTTCDREGAPAECVASRNNNCSTSGVPVTWPSTCVSSSVSSAGSAKRGISADTMRSIVHDAFQQWTTVTCADGNSPSFVVDMFPDVNCTDVIGDAGYNRNGPNYNLWYFEDNDWPHDNVGEDAIALTFAQFDENSGELYDADVELNSAGINFTLDPNSADIDLPSVVQHESGHFLGLAHSGINTATMWPSLRNGDASLRTLDPDDVAAICAAYPPGHLNPSCDPEPRHGFSTECTLQQHGGCALVPGSRAGGGRLAHEFVVFVLFGAAAASRRLTRTARFS